MADYFDILSSADQIQANYEKYADKFEDANADLVNAETFLSLLVAEMTNQDPLEPTSNTEFITQMAQFTQLQYLEDVSTYSMSSYASSLIGKTATASKMDGRNLVSETGVVTQVTKNGSVYTVTINGVNFDLSSVTSIAETASESSDVTNTVSVENDIGDQISRASLMIGMFAAVNSNDGSDSVIDGGVIESIQVKDGVINVVINGIAYKLSDVIEVAYPNYSDSDGETEEVEETVDPVEGDETDEIADEVLNAVEELAPETESEDLTDLDESDIVDEDDNGI